MAIVINGTTGISGVDGSDSVPSLVGTDTNTGMYFPSADTIAFSEGGTKVGEFDSSANFKFNSGYGSVATAYGCRAWVNFNGTGTVAIRASGNVSSITDNGTGDYTVNFTNSMPDASYVITGTVGTSNNNFNAPNGATATTSAVRIFTGTEASGPTDNALVSVSIFR